MRTNFICICVCLFIIFLNQNALALRKPLMEPPPTSFNAEKYLSKKYTENLGTLLNKARPLGDNDTINALSTLLITTRKDKSLKIFNGVEKNIKTLTKNNKALNDSVTKLLNEIRTEIESGTFNGHQAGISFEIDNKKKKYIVSWLEGNEEIVRNIPMPPAMDVIIKGEYILTKKVNKNEMIYRYWMKNGERSKAAVIGLMLPNMFPQTHIKKVMKMKHGITTKDTKLANNIELSVYYSMGNLNRFSLKHFNKNEVTKEGSLISYKPGQGIEYPFDLAEIEGGIPGVIKCYVELDYDDYKPYMGLLAEENDMATNTFAASKKQTSFMYSGNTVGPVPIPNPFDRVQFIDKVTSYINISVEEGWIENKEVIGNLKSALQKIKSNPGNKVQIKELIDSIEEYSKKEAMLSEAYSLLKYNLEYLLKEQ